MSNIDLSQLVTAEDKAAESRVKAETAARAIRNRLLKESDWTQLPDAPVDAKAWQKYRTKLRDLPKSKNWPDNITWPTPPEQDEANQ